MSPGSERESEAGDANSNWVTRAITSVTQGIVVGKPLPKPLPRKLVSKFRQEWLNERRRMDRINEPQQIGKYQNWFEITGQPNFAMYLMPFRGKPNLRFLQIGAFRGDATMWLLENILTATGCKLHDVDPWGKNDDYHELDMIEPDWEDVFTTYKKRTATWVDMKKLDYHRMTSNEFFHSHHGLLDFDFIYIDGAHDAVSVLEDAVHSYRLLKPRGIMGFDDYTWNAQDNDPLKAPGPAIDAVRWLYTQSGRMITLIMNNQVWMMKTG